MTNDVEEFEKLKKRVEDCRRKADKAAGARDQTLQTIKDEFGCDGIEEAREKLEELKEDLENKKAEYDHVYCHQAERLIRSEDRF